MIYDVAILGSGIGGLAIANECASRGSNCCLIEKDIAPSFSSVKNQGWLHSGALYAFHNAELAARECYDASQKLRSLMDVSGTNLSTLTGIAYFRDNSDAQQMVTRCNACGIPSRVLALSDLSEIGRSLMDGPNHNFAVEIPDAPISNFAFLAYLHAIGRSSGVEHLVTGTPFDEFQFMKEGTIWIISAGNIEIRARKIVLSCGPYIPIILSKFPSKDLSFSVKNCYVIAAKGFETDRLYISPTRNTRFMNVSPYNGGTTLNCGGLDEDVESAESTAIEKNTIRLTLGQVSKNWPAFTKSNPNIVTYVCQKLNVHNLPEEDRRRSFYRQVDSEVFVFYPGKFTLALDGAKALADVMIDKRSAEITSLKHDLTPPKIQYAHPADASDISYPLSDIIKWQT
jgi:glycine/D-amino acid oxidase-like deaminating enzyme